MIKIGNKEIGSHSKPFIIAEMSGNHNQSLDRALYLVELAAKSGADAIKLQTYTPDTITLDVYTNEFFINNENSLWKGQSLYDLYKQAYTPWEWHKEKKKKKKKLGILAFSSPFDETDVDFLESLDVPAYKIASCENIDIPLISKVAKTGKPIIISTGMANIAEIDEAVRTIRNEGNNQIILLKCTSSYPSTPENSNLATISHMKELFNTEVGLSDHTMGIGVSIASIAFGATVIEKHFTTARKDGGVDSVFSMEPSEFKMLVEETTRAWQGIGKIKYGPTKSEENSLTDRRSLYVGQDMKAGDIFTKDNLRDIRPGFGLHTRYFDILLGKTIKKDAKKGTALSWDFII